jgi:hypothetical protein
MPARALVLVALAALLRVPPVDGRDEDAVVGITMRNVHLRVAADAALDISWLRGTLRSTRPGQVPVFDDPSSFELSVDDGEMAIDAASLTALVNRAFSFTGSNLSDLRLTFDGARIVQRGTLSKGVKVPFSVTASIGATPEGMLRIHPDRIRTAGIPSGGMMRLFGIELDDLVRGNAAAGIRIDRNDLLLDPTRMLPPPVMHGRVSAAAVRGDRLVQTFGRGALAKPRTGGNYIWFRGGSIRFGKLTMADADLQLIDAQPSDPFDFYSAKYDRQLVAGYSKNTPQHGLRTYMPDYRRVAR